MLLPANWVDICPVTNAVSLPEQTGTLTWTKEISFPLPVNTKSFVLTVNQADGKVKVVNGTTSSKWFNASYDASTKLLVLKPKEIEEAFK